MNNKKMREGSQESKDKPARELVAESGCNRTMDASF
jgi:hypothetical protein